MPATEAPNRVHTCYLGLCLQVATCMKKLHQRTANSAFNTWREFASERQRLNLKMAHCLAALAKRSMAAAFHTWQVSKIYDAVDFRKK